MNAKLVAALALALSMTAGLSACGSKSNDGANAPAAQTTAAPVAEAAPVAQIEADSSLDEIDPFDANVDAKLAALDAKYEAETGVSAHLPTAGLDFFGPGCRRESCAVYARVNKSAQRLSLYLNGSLIGTYATSTGVAGRGTPNFDKHPDGRVYDRYTSTKFPGGDYNGLGNMPYAVFISGGFAIHGTGKSNWPKLGRVASHGCIRIHPDNAVTFNRLVRQYGVSNTWITVE